MNAPDPDPGSDPQALSLRSFTFLHQLRPDWAGRLILSVGLGPEGAALALAANIAGAISLSLEADAFLHREALRSSSCDFIVKTLDEALRAMKNETRKGQPISVGLQGNIPAILYEIVERGVVPDLFVNTTEPHTPLDETTVSYLHVHGASIVAAAFITSEAEAYAVKQHWNMYCFAPADLAALRAIDAMAVSLLRTTPPDPLRRKWLNAAPKILQHQHPLRRFLWLNEAEHARLIEMTNVFARK